MLSWGKITWLKSLFLLRITSKVNGPCSGVSCETKITKCLTDSTRLRFIYLYSDPVVLDVLGRTLTQCAERSWAVASRGRLQESKNKVKKPADDSQSGRSHLLELFITELRSHLKPGFTMLVLNRAGRLRAWSQNNIVIGIGWPKRSLL